jgi:propane monooxygenase reductase subunit
MVLKMIGRAEIKFFPGSTWTSRPGHLESRRTRWPTSRRDGGVFEFVIKSTPTACSRSSSRPRWYRVGDRLEVEAPFGTFTLREGRSTPLIFVGGGAGMAPMLGPAALDGRARVERPVTFYYGRSHRRDLCFSDELAELGTRLTRFTYVPALSEPTRATAGRARPA